MNRHREAIDCFREVLASDPDDFMALVNFGYSCLMTGREGMALVQFEKACTIKFHSGRSGTTELYLQLARLYLQAGLHDKACHILEMWQDEQGEKKEFVLYRLLGEAYMECSRLSEAMQALQRALQLHPGNDESMSMLGLLYIEDEQGEEVGMSLLEKALSVDAMNADHWYRKGRALVHLGRISDGLLAVNRSLQLQRTHVAATILKGRILEKMGRTRQAAAVYARVPAMKRCTSVLRKKAERYLSQMQVTRA